MPFFLFFLSEFLNGSQNLYSFCFQSISVYDWNPFRNYDLEKELIIVSNLDKKKGCKIKSFYHCLE